MNAEEYKTKYNQKILILFLNKYHKNSDVLFWPDLATIYYEESAQKCLNDNKIQFLQRIIARQTHHRFDLLKYFVL